MTPIAKWSSREVVAVPSAVTSGSDSMNHARPARVRCECGKFYHAACAATSRSVSRVPPSRERFRLASEFGGNCVARAAQLRLRVHG